MDQQAPVQFTQLSQFQALKQHFQETSQLTMRDMFKLSPSRFAEFSAKASDLTLDFSKNRITFETLSLLMDLARARGLQGAIDSMFRGDLINKSEQRSALHTALRNFSDEPVYVDDKDVMPEVRDTLTRMKEFCWKIRNQHWRGFKMLIHFIGAQ